MATGIAEYGDKEFSGTFSWDNNELHRKIYIKDFTKIKIVLDLLFGDPNNAINVKSFTPHKFQYPFDSFYVYGVQFQPVHQKSTQFSSESELTTNNIKNMLDSVPYLQGGAILDITYKPYDYYYGTNEETADYSAQVMTILSNATSQLNNADGSTNAVTWSDGSMVTNLSGIIKVIPKIELLQRKLFLRKPPTTDQVALIGCINDVGMPFTSAGDDGRFWPKGTLMLAGLPTIRRWRYDGEPVFEVTVKMSANMYQDKVLKTGGSVDIDYVTWNRLFRVSPHGHWDYVIMPTTKTKMYREADLTFVNNLQD